MKKLLEKLAKEYLNKLKEDDFYVYEFEIYDNIETTIWTFIQWIEEKKVLCDNYLEFGEDELESDR